MNHAAFFSAVRSSVFSGTLSQAQVDGITTILAACDAHGVVDQEERAYILATATWETNYSLLPVREAYWVKNAEAWRKANLRYWPYYGRGYVQLTWEENYRTMGKLLGIDLVKNPDLALETDVAAKVLVIGMRDGYFGPKAGPLSNFLGLPEDWLGARRTVNGVDKAAEIAALGKKFDIAFELAEGPAHLPAPKPPLLVYPPAKVPVEPDPVIVTKPHTPILQTPPAAPVEPPKVTFWSAIWSLVVALLNRIKVT